MKFMAGDSKNLENLENNNGAYYDYELKTKPVIDDKRIRQSQPKNHKRLLIGALSIIFITLLAVAGLWSWHYIQTKKIKDQIPISIQNTVNFSIYIPAKKDYSVLANSFIYDNDILQFKIKNDDEAIQFSQQIKSGDFDLSKFASGIGISNAEQSTVNAGKILYGKVGNFTIAIIDTKETIITITSTQPNTDLKPVTQTLKRIN